jgi:hypothetical protein
VRILKELRRRFAEVRILKGLALFASILICFRAMNHSIGAEE